MSLNTAESQNHREAGVEVTANSKSVVTAFQDVLWLLIVLLICATTIAASSLVSRPGFNYFRQVAARYL
jgi:hypothetical protein